MALFRFAPRWYDMAREWDDQSDYPPPRSVTDWQEQRDRDLEDWLNYRLLGGAINITSPPSTNDYIVWDGTQWINTNGVWTTFTTTWSGTIGNGTIASAYHRIGRTINYRISVAWGSTTSHAAAAQTFTLPVNAHADYDQHAWVGMGGAKDASAGPTTTFGAAHMLGGDAVSIIVSTAGLSSAAVWNNAAPMTWTTGDVARIRGTYQSAA